LWEKFIGCETCISFFCIAFVPNILDPINIYKFIQYHLTTIIIIYLIRNSLSTILPVVLDGCETWSFPLRRKTRIEGFENELRKKNLDLIGRIQHEPRENRVLTQPSPDII
jgi:hypothetical protein